LNLEVEDHGRGIGGEAANKGIGMVAMRERAELLGGMIDVSKPAQGGTIVSLAIPRETLDGHAG